METPPNIRLAVPFFMVKDIEMSLDFYINKLGFKLANQWTPRGKIEWCWLERESVALMLQQPAKHNHWLYSLPEPAKGVSICFQCEDALALYHEFIAKGVGIKDPFVGNNMWVVAFSDPDGYRLDFESPTNVPEDTMYSEWVKING